MSTVRAFFHRLLDALFPLVPDPHPACLSRLDELDGIGGNHY